MAGYSGCPPDNRGNSPVIAAQRIATVSDVRFSSVTWHASSPNPDRGRSDYQPVFAALGRMVYSAPIPPCGPAQILRAAQPRATISSRYRRAVDLETQSRSATSTADPIPFISPRMRSRTSSWHVTRRELDIAPPARKGLVWLKWRDGGHALNTPVRTLPNQESIGGPSSTACNVVHRSREHCAKTVDGVRAIRRCVRSDRQMGPLRMSRRLMQRP